MIWRFRDRALELTGDPPLIMAILNLTPDSFSDGGTLCGADGLPDVSRAVDTALRLVDEGAAILDLGGESTRPGFTPVSVELEKKRVLPVLEAIRARCDVPISVDSRHAEVIAAALDAGADIINDVDGLASDALGELARKSGAGVIAMQNGRLHPIDAADPVESTLSALRHLADRALSLGIERERLCLDPGIGFTPSLTCDVALCAACDRLRTLGFPVVLGPSRKRFLGSLTQKSTECRDFATAAAVACISYAGTDILRLHLVTEMRDAIAVARALCKLRSALMHGA